jgi:hypothetical protein
MRCNDISGHQFWAEAPKLASLPPGRREARLWRGRWCILPHTEGIKRSGSLWRLSGAGRTTGCRPSGATTLAWRSSPPCAAPRRGSAAWPPSAGMRTGLLPVRGVHLDEANGRDRPLKVSSPVRGGLEIAHHGPFFERVSSPYAGVHRSRSLASRRGEECAQRHSLGFASREAGFDAGMSAS